MKIILNLRDGSTEKSGQFAEGSVFILSPDKTTLTVLDDKWNIVFSKNSQSKVRIESFEVEL